jgi:hypothetical protein
MDLGHAIGQTEYKFTRPSFTREFEAIEDMGFGFSTLGLVAPRAPNLDLMSFLGSVYEEALKDVLH